MKTIRALMALAGLAAGSLCHAGEGAFEINQACADVGCFPGDTAGLPVTITAPGTYHLTGNLTATNVSTHGIVVAASDVTIDMKGFRIVGPITCGGRPTTCTPAATGSGAIGVDGWLHSPSNLTIRNGSITGMGTGLLLSYDGRAEGIKAIQNGDAGIRARSGAAVVDSVGTANGRLGIEAGLMSGCVASRNRAYGLATQGDAASIQQSIAQDNDDYGMYLAPGAIVSGVTVSGNRIGIFATGGSQIIDSMFRNNVLVGVTNSQGMISIARSSFVGNNGGGLQWGGDVLQLAPNMCGTTMTCP
ncbi:hypothetical protein ACQQ2N_01560 [Dokdonella sp. MW10]|uniref:hypothetical protein n=1 Tax=Dokdonella sp. MW10 TaxID=2992926 RepID=UPI003F80AB82